MINPSEELAFQSLGLFRPRCYDTFCLYLRICAYICIIFQAFLLTGSCIYYQINWLVGPSVTVLLHQVCNINTDSAEKSDIHIEFWVLHLDKIAFISYRSVYTGCPTRNVPDFGRVFLRSNYTDITQNTYVQSWTVTEIMARELWQLLHTYLLPNTY